MPEGNFETLASMAPEDLTKDWVLVQLLARRHAAEEEDAVAQNARSVCVFLRMKVWRTIRTSRWTGYTVLYATVT